MMKKIHFIGTCVATGLILLSAGCSDGDGSGEESADTSSGNSERLAEGERLSLGTSGPIVASVNQMLLNQGYYENPSLAESYPDWTPVVGEAPEQMDRFDEQLESALIAFQSKSGLDVSGTIDQATLDELSSRSCDWPESYEEEGQQKWHINTGRYVSGTSVTYRVDGYPCEFINSQGQIEQILGCTLPSRSQLDQVLARAFTTWQNSTKLNFTPTTSTSATITFKWSSSLASSTLASASGSGARVITFNSTKSWSTGTSAVSGKYSLEAVGLHEIGHSLGFKHTTVKIGANNPVMWPSIGTGTHLVTFGPDDYQAIMASIYTQWAKLPGKATHVASNSGVTWAISNTSVAGGRTILYWNGSAWETITGGALKVAVGTDRVPWLVNNANQIYYRSGVSSANGYRGTGWVQVSGAATDIALGGTTVYVVGAESGGSGGNKLWRRESNGSWTQLPGAAVHIAADANGAVWVVDAFSNIHRMQPGATTWTLMPGQARDIGASGGAAWVIGTGGSGGNYEIWVWNEQPAGTSGSPPPAAQNQWFKNTDGTAAMIAVDNAPSPWIINANNDIYHRVF